MRVSGRLGRPREAAGPDEQHRRLVELVCGHVAIVLGHTSGHDIDAGALLKTSDSTRSPVSNSATDSGRYWAGFVAPP